MRYTIGLDVGATKISAGLVSNNTVTHHITLPTESASGPRAIIANIERAIGVFFNPHISGIGIGLAGQIDAEHGIVVSTGNMHKKFSNVHLQKIIQKTFHRPVAIENDVKCFTLGESHFGAGKKSPFVVGLTLGTGIGGGIAVHGEIFTGAQGTAGEFGHMTIVENGQLCGCGQYGHFEAYASGSAMVELYRQKTGHIFDTFVIEKRAIRKEKAALSVINTMAEALGLGLANIVHIINPNVIVLGGGMIRVKILMQPALKIAQRRIFKPQLRSTTIVLSKLNDQATILGAASLLTFK